MLPTPRHVQFSTFHRRAGRSDGPGSSVVFSRTAFVHRRTRAGTPGPRRTSGDGSVCCARTLQLGARLARPGEFSERAFLNDKLDLAQAEAIADLIDAGTAQAARAALRSLQGEFSQRVHALIEHLIQLRMYVEAAIDFPEEEVDFLDDGRFSSD